MEGLLHRKGMARKPLCLVKGSADLTISGRFGKLIREGWGTAEAEDLLKEVLRIRLDGEIS